MVNKYASSLGLAPPMAETRKFMKLGTRPL